jgi:DNA-binding response OmpR family regulator
LHLLAARFGVNPSIVMARVLVVEDERDIREAVEAVLVDEGYEVVGACDGADALQKLHACHPGLVLLDLMMPRMDGWQFRAAQQRDPEVSGIPVVVLSALGYVPELDAADYLPKPFDLERLVTCVRRHVAVA